MVLCEQVQELIPAHSAHALDEEEALLVEAHVARCEQCSALLEDYRRATAGLAGLVRRVRPPRRLRRRVLRAVEEESREGLPGVYLRPRGRTLPAPAVAALAVLVLLLTGFSAWSALHLWRLERTVQVQGERVRLMESEYDQALSLLRGQTPPSLDVLMAIPGAQVASLTGVKGVPYARGSLLIPGDVSVGILVVTGLPPLEEDMVYQVWLERGNERVNAGFLVVDPSGWGMTVLRTMEPLYHYHSVGVSMGPRYAVDGEGLPLLQGNIVQ